MPGQIGRPRKSSYLKILRALDVDEIYSLATIAKFAQERHFLELSSRPTQEEIDLAYLRVRISFGRLSNLYGFPDEGDGHVRIQGQTPISGWFGWRWKEVLALM